MSRRRSTNSVDLIYEDPCLLVCRKPAGTATEGGSLRSRDMESMLKNYRAGKGEKPEIFVVHRLDQPVEGLLLFAKDSGTAAVLSGQVREHRVKKCYLAVGEGEAEVPLPPGGILEDWMERVPDANQSRICGEGAGKRAELAYRVLAHRLSEKSGADDRRSRQVLFDIDLHTGRHHQIRLQLANLGWPILGDRRYGGAADGTLALCANRLEFDHPGTGERLVFSIEPEHTVIRELLSYA